MTRDIPNPRDDAGDRELAEDSIVSCGTCGRPMAIKEGRFGQFLACTGYPECRTTRKIQKDGNVAAPDVVLEELCPRCGKQMVLKQGRFGPFTACSNYPNCKYIKQETIGVRCPECGSGELVVKKSKRGSFYGCANYPTCKFTLWDKPMPQSCPECGARFLVEKVKKDGSRELQCRADGCRFKQALPDLEQGKENLKNA